MEKTPPPSKEEETTESQIQVDIESEAFKEGLELANKLRVIHGEESRVRRLKGGLLG